MKAGMTIEEISTEILRQRQTKIDYLIDTRRLEMENWGASIVLRILDDNACDLVEPLDINQIAHRQIGARLQIPASYYDRMLANNPELLVRNVNTWFKQEPAQRMIRTLDGTARAYLSNKYRRVDHLEILQAVLPVIGEIPDVRFASCQITNSQMYLKVINPHLQAEVTAGDIVQAGVAINNSEIGMGAVCVQPLVFRLSRGNGIIISDAQTRKTHRGRTNIVDDNFQIHSDETLAADDLNFLLMLQETVRAAVDEARFNQVVELMRETTQMRMNTTNIPETVRLASKDFKLTEIEGEGVLHHFTTDQDLTLYGLANAVSRYSQDVEDYDRASKLEGIGYDMLSMSRMQWTRINRIHTQDTPPVIQEVAA